MKIREHNNIITNSYNTFDNINMNIGFLIKSLGEQIDKDLKKCYEKYELTVSQADILKYIRANIDREITQKDIEVYMGVSHPTTVGLLQRLEAKGYITTKVIVRKRMIKIVTPTKKEEDIYQEISHVFKKSCDRIFGKLDTVDSEQLKEILLKI